MRSTLGLLLLLGACGSVDDKTHHDAAIDTPTVHVDAPPDTPTLLDAPPGTTPLTVKNYLSWCSVKVNGAATGSTAPSIVVNVMPGTIPITATAASATFEIAANMWHHTDGDSGTGDSGTVTGGQSAVTATVGTTAKCVWVCCPFANGTGCPTTEQCN